MKFVVLFITGETFKTTKHVVYCVVNISGRGFESRRLHQTRERRTLKQIIEKCFKPWTDFRSRKAWREDEK